MDSAEILGSDPAADGGSLSPTLSASATLVPTPTSSETGGANPDPEHNPMPAEVPAGPLRVTSLSTTSWRQQYPRIGQFAMTPSEEVVAAGPDGLIYFMRVQDHPSQPWSEPRPFPPTTARLDASTVTALVLHRERGTEGRLHVYCVADGVLHAFSRSEDSHSSFVQSHRPPFTGSRISGTPAVANIGAYDLFDGSERWCLVAPCQTGGILYTSRNRCGDSPSSTAWQAWKFAHKVAAHMGIVSAVSAVGAHVSKLTGKCNSFGENTPVIVAACITSGQLRSVEWPLKQPPVPGGLENPKSIRVHHPGEVTGNPVLIRKEINSPRNCTFDLLVPSAEGGIFHFIKTPTSPDEWHMVARVSFPPEIPIVSSLACSRLNNSTYGSRPEFRAHVLCGGRLYVIETSERYSPWYGSRLCPIEGPGPSLC